MTLPEKLHDVNEIITQMTNDHYMTKDLKIKVIIVSFLSSFDKKKRFLRDNIGSSSII